jgi:hypothetical protein
VPRFSRGAAPTFPDQEGRAALPTAGQPVSAVVGGPAEALLLLLWRRTTLDDPRLRHSGSGPRPSPCSMTPHALTESRVLDAPMKN